MMVIVLCVFYFKIGIMRGSDPLLGPVIVLVGKQQFQFLYQQFIFYSTVFIIIFLPRVTCSKVDTSVYVFLQLQ